jgi:cytidylate kinase
MVVTIDGPAGAGKSSIARAVAERLGFRFLDTGAMYRVVALAAQRRGVPLQDAAALGDLVRRITIDLSRHAVRLDGDDVSSEIRRPEITLTTRHVADNVQVREHLVQQQRRLAQGGNFVTEGRDQGTVAFPDAECKIFLTASPEERARRRAADLQSQGQPLPWEVVLQQQNERDERDRQRPVGGLRQADDATVVNTDGMTIEQVVDRVEKIVRQAMQRQGA